MKGAKKRYKLPAPRMITGHFNCRFHGFCAGVAEIDPFREIARNQRGELLRQLHHVFVVKIRPRHVDQLGRLLANRLHDFGMAVPRRDHRNSGVAVEKAIAVDV